MYVDHVVRQYITTLPDGTEVVTEVVEKVIDFSAINAELLRVFPYFAAVAGALCVVFLLLRFLEVVR